MRTTPNKHGVFEDPEVVVLFGARDDLRRHLSLDLARDEAGLWHYGYRCSARVYGFSTPCLAGSESYADHAAAIAAALGDLAYRLHRERQQFGEDPDTIAFLAAIDRARAPQLDLFAEMMR